MNSYTINIGDFALRDLKSIILDSSCVLLFSSHCHLRVVIYDCTVFMSMAFVIKLNFHLPTVWRDLAKFRQFDKLFTVVGHFLVWFNQYFANIFTHFGNFYVTGQFFIVAIGQRLKNKIAKWSSAYQRCYRVSVWLGVLKRSRHFSKSCPRSFCLKGTFSK